MGKRRSEKESLINKIGGEIMDILSRIDMLLIKEKDESKYDIFFKAKMKEWKISSPDELSKEDKKKFFDEIDKEWKGEKS